MPLTRLLVFLIAIINIAACQGATLACDDFVPKVPNLRRPVCDSLRLVDMQARSVRGRTLWGRDIAGDEPALRVLVVGGIHGDEMSSSALVLNWMSLAQTPLADMPQAIHWRFIPLLNPDGMLAKPPLRVNAHGVDLNRNFPTKNWERDAKLYWEKRTRKDPRRYPGQKPLSEPESRFLHAQIQSFKPQLIVSVHAPYGVLDFDGPAAAPSKLGRLYLDQVGIFPGSLGNYAGVQQGVPVVTIELPSAARTPVDAEVRQMWLDLIRWTMEHVAAATPTSVPRATP